MVSTGLEELDQILGHGYPERSSVLLSGPPGIGKEALAYSFVTSAPRGEFSLYVTRLASQDVIEDMHGFGMDASSVAWISKNGTGARCDLNDLAGLSFNIKETLKQNLGQRVRVVLDVCSSLLMLNPTEVVYRFISQLLGDIKQYDAVALATIDEGMHPPQVVAAMAQLFDGVLELRLFEQGLRLVPLLRIAKMRGLPPQAGYYDLSFTTGRMEIQAHVK